MHERETAADYERVTGVSEKGGFDGRGKLIVADKLTTAAAAADGLKENGGLSVSS